jgi:hypothetical protein
MSLPVGYENKTCWYTRTASEDCVGRCDEIEPCADDDAEEASEFERIAVNDDASARGEESNRQCDQCDAENEPGVRAVTGDDVLHIAVQQREEEDQEDDAEERLGNGEGNAATHSTA